MEHYGLPEEDWIEEVKSREMQLYKVSGLMEVALVAQQGLVSLLKVRLTHDQL